MTLHCFDQYLQRINLYLENLNTLTVIEPPVLGQALKYVLMANGKRIRPFLVYATGKAFAGDLSHLDRPAAAVELIHSYSLVHDDLPAMDNADLRRGKPTCHKEFDEATAILIGDALQVLAFEILTINQKNPAQQLKMVAVLAKACGITGMVAGQALDLQMNQLTPNLQMLENMYNKKTGALIIASVELGALAAGIESEEILTKLRSFAQALGLAYQIQDDILDIETDTEILGKTQGLDQINNKITYPTIIGINDSKKRVEELYEIAFMTVNDLENAADLKNLANFLLKRTY